MPLNVHDSGRFVFGLDRSVELDPERGRLVIILLALLTLILAGAFLSMRSILRPVRWLHEGVREVGRGSLKHRVPLKRSYELRDLAAAFNDMTDRIQDMLHTKEKLMLDVSHELRSPLTRMNVALEFLPDCLTPRHLQHLSPIHSNGSSSHEVQMFFPNTVCHVVSGFMLFRRRLCFRRH